MKKLPPFDKKNNATIFFPSAWLFSRSSQYLFLPKDYSGSPTVSLNTPWTEAEVRFYLTAGCGSGAISDLKLEYLYGPEAESSGE
tara:strand:- start:16 stop:270 length:255 start_codon:yes stop_codon:yes gene_type:complete